MTSDPLTCKGSKTEERHYGTLELERNEEDAGSLEAPVTMENVLQELGVPGRYQVIQIIALILCLTPFASVMLNFVFIGYEPLVKCRVINETSLLAKYKSTNDSMAKIGYDSCYATLSFNVNKTKNEIDIPCDAGYDYEDDPLVSMATEWNLLCDKRGVVELVQTALTLGLTVSSASVTNVADRFGRKYVYMIVIAIMITAEVGLYFANTVYLAIVLRLISGLSSGGMYAIHKVVSMELIVSKYRHVYGLMNCIWWGINMMLLAGVAFAFKHNWRYMQLAGALTGIPAFLAAFIVHETPIWAVACGQISRARQILCRASRVNKKDSEKVLKTLQLSLTKADVSPKFGSSNDFEKYSCLDFFQNRKLMQITIILGFAWFATSTTYYGLYLISSRLAGNRFLNFFLMALSEIPSSLVAMLLLVYVGRRTIVMAFMAMAGICMVVATSVIVAEPVSGGFVTTVFSLVGKFAIGTAYNTLNTYTAELYPTTLRSTGYGVCSSMANLGALLAPFLNPLFKYLNWVPGVIFSSLCFLSFIFLWKLPETKGRQLPNTVAEIQAWGK